MKGAVPVEIRNGHLPKAGNKPLLFKSTCRVADCGAFLQVLINKSSLHYASTWGMLGRADADYNYDDDEDDNDGYW
jgi:hypothetical protein